MPTNKTKKRTRRRQTTRVGERGDYSSRIISELLIFQTTLKLFHWNTSRFAQHNASDQLYNDLSKNIDSFVEKMLGTHNRNSADHIIKEIKVSVKNPSLSGKDIIRKADSLKLFLGELSSHINLTSDLLNLRDEMLGQLNQFLYLIRLK